MNKVATGIIVGSIVGASSVALMNLDKRDMRKFQRRGKQLLNRAENLMDDLKGMM